MNGPDRSFSTEAEQALLGALLLDNSAFARVAPIVSAAHFSEGHQAIYRAIAALIEANQPADLATVAEHMERASPELLERAGGAVYLAQLAQATPGSQNIERYAELVRDRAVQGDDAPSQSEDQLALVFTELHGNDRKYIQLWRRWYEWDSTRWRPDTTLHTRDLARKVIRERAASVEKSTAAAAMASAKTVAAVEHLARADRRHATTPEQFDEDPLLLNTPAGTVDLRNGELREHRREDWLTKRTAVGPEHREPKRWLEFLRRATNGDGALMQFLQLAVGYSLTGLTTEHAFFFVYGPGSNGKSTFVNTLVGILGDYAEVASAETFLEARGERHPADLAALRGARLVLAQEVDDGQRLALGRVKGIVAGDPISARFMRADFFTYTPQLKLWFSANHRPGLRTVDEAIRRRLNLVPFTVFIPPEERDPDLPAALKEEWGAILAWGLEGCAEWQLHGIAQPPAVRDATAAYLGEEDIFGMWLADACELDPSADEPVSRLHESYRRWAERAGERFLGTKRFSQALAERGLERVKMSAGVRGFVGVRLRPKPEAEVKDGGSSADV